MVTNIPLAPGSPTIEAATIGPDRAEQWLGRNRRIRPSLLAKLSGAMRRGEWLNLNGETIKFSYTGKLLDGQHRLLAIIESGATIESFVIHGLPEEAQDTVDTGAPRTAADVFALYGYKRAVTAAAALRYLWVLRAGLLRPTGGGEYRAGVTPQALLALADEYPQLGESIEVTNRLTQAFRGSGAQYAALHAHFATLDRTMADEFFEQLGTGLGLQRGSPIYALRRWLEQRPVAKGGHLTRISRLAVHIVFVKAWNAYRRDAEVKAMRYSLSEPIPLAE